MSLGAMMALAGAMLVISATPGPSDIAVAGRSLSDGLGAAASMIAGILAADYLFIILAVLGMATVAEHHAGLFRAVKFAGGGYLVWLGVSRLRAASTMPGSSPGAGSHLSGFVGGMMITLADPKAILFYMSLLPAFVDPATVGVVEVLAIMLIATMVIGGVKGCYALLARRVDISGDGVARRRVEALAGLVLSATGLYLAVDALFTPTVAPAS